MPLIRFHWSSRICDPWAEKVTGVQDKHFSKTTEKIKASSCKATPLRKDQPLQGWALKSQRKGQRVAESVKVVFHRKTELCGKLLPSFYRSSRPEFNMSLFRSHVMLVND